jgi:hypothetical protein
VSAGAQFAYRRRDDELAARGSKRWQFFKGGSAIDGRGDRRSAKRLARQELCRRHAVTSGRQWVRLRRQLRRRS